MTTNGTETETGGVGHDGEDDKTQVDHSSSQDEGNSSSEEGEDFQMKLGTISPPKRSMRNAQAKRIQRKPAAVTNASKRSVIVLPKTQTVPVFFVCFFMCFVDISSVENTQRCVLRVTKLTAFRSGSFLTGSYDLFP